MGYGYVMYTCRYNPNLFHPGCVTKNRYIFGVR